MREFLRRLHYYFRRRQFEADMEEEMQHHRSLSGDKQFGNVGQIKEATREMWAYTFLDRLVQDLRYALRSMRKNPLFTSMAVLSLALGIGANTAIFSFMDSILMRQLPVAEPESLVMLKWRGENAGATGVMTSTNGGSNVNGVETVSVFTRAMFDQFAARGDVFSSVFAYMKGQGKSAVVDGTADLADLVNQRFVREHYGAGPAVGRFIRMLGNDWEIVGVSADAYFGTVKNEVRPMIYVPYGQGPFLNQMTYVLRTAGDPTALGPAVREIVRQMNPLVLVPKISTQKRQIDRQFNQEIIFARLCSAFAALALLIAGVGLYATMSFNVAHRTGEIGVRMALGAGRSSLVWLVLRGVFLLVLTGLAIGLPVALASTKVIESYLWGIEPNDPLSIAAAIFVLAVSALVAGYLPARRASRTDPMVALRHE